MTRRGRWTRAGIAGLALLAGAGGALSRGDNSDEDVGTSQGGLRTGPDPAAKARPGRFALTLKDGMRHLVSLNCSTEIALQPGPTPRGNRCGEWRIVPVNGPWFKVLLEGRGWYLDGCGNRPHLADEARGQAAGCQMWAETQDDAQGWRKFQLRADGRFLDADHCSDRLAMNSGSDWAGGACQRWLWKEVR